MGEKKRLCFLLGGQWFSWGTVLLKPIVDAKNRWMFCQGPTVFLEYFLNYAHINLNRKIFGPPFFIVGKSQCQSRHPSDPSDVATQHQTRSFHMDCKVTPTVFATRSFMNLGYLINSQLLLWPPRQLARAPRLLRSCCGRSVLGSW